jgi:hypothetical protein
METCAAVASVDVVPWNASWAEMFALHSARLTCCRCRLSQLDRSCFRGLESQYNFMLNFRFHSHDKQHELPAVVGGATKRSS